MGKSLKTKIENEISECIEYQFDFFFKHKGKSEPVFVKCKVNLPKWYPTEINRKNIYDDILINFVRNDDEVSAAYVNIPNVGRDGEDCVRFCLRDLESNSIWPSILFKKGEIPNFKYGKKVLIELKLPVEKKDIFDFYMYYEDGDNYKFLEINPTIYWPTCSIIRDRYDILKELYSFVGNSHESVRKIYSKKFYHASGHVCWYFSEGGTWLDEHRIPESMDSEKLESYQLESRYESYENMLRREHDDNYGQSYGRYSGSWAQDVQDLSDDFIDDVLGGDPDAYWNID